MGVETPEIRSVVELQEILPHCAFYAHFKPLESFGILAVEAMSYGAIPIVFRSDHSATWIDIVQKGKFGLGFSTVEEFVNLVSNVAGNRQLEEELRVRASIRSQAFSLERFRERFLELLRENM